MKPMIEQTWFFPALTILGLLGLVWISVGLQDVVRFAKEMREIHAPMQDANHNDVLRSHIELYHRTTELIADVEALKGRIVGDVPAGYHRYDHVEWCEAFKKENANRYPDLICPDPRTLPRYLEMVNTGD